NPIGGIGIAFGTNGALANVTSTTPLDIGSGDPINAILIYAGGHASLTLTDAVAHTTFTTNANFNIPALVGANTAYIGFTGATGGTTATQTVSNFAYYNLYSLTAQISGSNIIIAWPAGVNEWGVYALQQKANLGSGSWSSVPQPVTVVGGMNQVTIPLSVAGAYYRLQLQ